MIGTAHAYPATPGFTDEFHRIDRAGAGGADPDGRPGAVDFGEAARELRSARWTRLPATSLNRPTGARLSFATVTVALDGIRRAETPSTPRSRNWAIAAG